MNIFKNAKPILEKLIQNGFEAYFVGGCVRDQLLNREIGDIDIATNALPKEVMNIFNKTVPTGLQHGTVLVIENNESYEITTFRTESTYIDYRRPSDVTFVKSIEEDLKRRDFTMNAIAMTIDYELIDPFNGKNDIENKVINAVGHAQERFHEDALRMMRGIRFVSQLDFQMHDDTFNAIIESSKLIEKIAIERINVEFEKMLLGTSPKKAIYFLIKSKLTEYLPYFNKRQSIFLNLIELPIESLKSIEEYWAIVLYFGKYEDPELLLRSWKMSNDRIKGILKLHSLVESDEIIWSNSNLYVIGIEDAIKYERIQFVLGNRENRQSEHSIKNQYSTLPILKKSDLCITGNDLLNWSNRNGGPWLKEVITEIEMQVVENKLHNNQPAVKEWFLKWLQK